MSAKPAGVTEAEVREKQRLRSLATLDTLDYRVRSVFCEFWREANEVARTDHGAWYTAISGHRGKTEQEALYALGRTKGGKIVTNARWGYSNHNFGIAVDFGVFVLRGGKLIYADSDLPTLARMVHLACAELSRSYPLEAGAHWKNFPDLPHYEYRTGLTMAEKRKKYAERGTVLW